MTSKKVVDCLKNSQYYLRVFNIAVYIYIFGKSPFVIEINRRTKWATCSVANSKLQTLLNHQLWLLKTQFSMAYPSYVHVSWAGFFPFGAPRMSWYKADSASRSVSASHLFGLREKNTGKPHNWWENNGFCLGFSLNPSFELGQEESKIVVEKLKRQFPDAPCMEYLPTFGPVFG